MSEWHLRIEAAAVKSESRPRWSADARHGARSNIEACLSRRGLRRWGGKGSARKPRDPGSQGEACDGGSSRNELPKRRSTQKVGGRSSIRPEKDAEEDGGVQ